MGKILVVDDSETVRVQLKKDLEGAGHQVIEAADGVLGLQALKENTDTQLILCDVNMPNMDGLTMCLTVRQENLGNGVNIFMLTTENNPDMKTKGKEAGVRAWITKPYIAEKLLTAVNAVLKK